MARLTRIDSPAGGRRATRLFSHLRWATLERYKARLDEVSFRALFRKSPIKRIGRDRFVRNVLIAIGNSNDLSLIPEATRLLNDPSPLVRAMAVWALAQLGALPPIRRDDDPAVESEWSHVAAPA